MITIKPVTLIAIVFIAAFAACKGNNPTKATFKDTVVKAEILPVVKKATTAPVTITVANVKDSIAIMVNSKPVALENLAATLAQLLVLQEDIPGNIPVKYKGEVLMGMRSEITSEINAGIKNAKDVKYKIFADAVIPSVAKEVKVPVTLDVQFFRQQGNDAFLSATMMDPDGYELELEKTPHAKEAESGSYTTKVFALLHYNNGQWGITTVSIGATGVPVICWWKAFNVPKTLFPADLAVSDCR